MKRFFILSLFALVAFSINAQNNLSAAYKNAASSPDFLNICGDADYVVVTVKTEGLSAVSRTNISATLKLFKGIEFLSLDPLNTSPGVTVTSMTNRNQPIFALPNLVPNGTNSIQIGFRVAADCVYLDSINANNNASVFDTWTFKYNLGTQTNLMETDATEEYRSALKVPAFNIVFNQNNPPATRVGDCYTRTITVPNTGLAGFVDSLFYTDKLGAGVSLKKLLVNGVAVPFTKQGTSTDTLIRSYIWGQWFQTATTNSGLGDGDVFLDPNEKIVITEEICMVSCQNLPSQKPLTSTHTVAWGCKGRFCNSVSVNGFVRKGSGSPNALIEYLQTNPENIVVGYCKPGRLVFHYKNNGSELDPGFANMRDIEVKIGMNLGVLLQTSEFSVTAIKVANKVVPITSNTIVFQGNPLFSTNPDGPGGLEDLDNDGFFDDLKTGNGFDVVVDFAFNCANANMPGADSLCLNNINVAWNAYMTFSDQCRDKITKILPSVGAINHLNQDYVNCVDPDAYPNQKFTFSHVESRNVRGFDKNCNGAERIVAFVVLKPGVMANLADMRLFRLGSTIATPMLSNYMSNDTLFMEFDATSPNMSGKYDFRIFLTPTCAVPAGRIIIPFGVFFKCPSCNCKHTWFCTELDGPQFHPASPPCATGITCPKGLQTTDFDVERTTFGFTNNTYTTPMNPALANKDVAIFCDTVKMTVRNRVGQTIVSDSVGVVISYDNIDFMKDTIETFLFKRGLITIKKGAQTYKCTVMPNDYTIIRDDTSKILRFRFDRCLTQYGITLSPGDQVDFCGWFLVNPLGPIIENFRKVPNFRAYGYAIFDGKEYACDNFGENFSLAKMPALVYTPISSEFPKGCSNTVINYRLSTKNVGFQNFYTGGETYASLKVDSIVLDYDPAWLSAFQNLKVEAYFAGHPTYGNTFYPITGFKSTDNGHFVARFDTLTKLPSYNVSGSSLSFQLRISVTPECESAFGSAMSSNLYKLNSTMYFREREFAKRFGDGSCSLPRKVVTIQSISYTDAPTISFEPVTNPNLFLTNDTAIWIIKQCNTSTKSDANLLWMSAQYDTSQLRIVGMDLIDNPAAPVSLVLNTFANGELFTFTPGVLRQGGANTAAQICNTIRVKALMKKCGTFPIKLKQGWNCEPYTNINWNPTLYAPCAYDTISLSVTALDPNIEAAVLNQPAEYPSLCDTVKMEILVRNTGQGTVLNMKSRFSIPLLGANFVPFSVDVAYPSTAAYQPVLINPTLVGTTSKGRFYEYDGFQNMHPYLAANGLSGFSASQAAGANEYKIRFKFVTTCNFQGGVQSFYRFSGQKVCGATSNTENGESLPIVFTGQQPLQPKLFVAGFGPNTYLSSNGISNMQVFATNQNASLTTIKDKIQVKLPNGVVYQSGTAVAISPTAWTPGNPQITTIAGITLLTWPMPAGILNNQTVRLDFKVMTPALTCNDLLEASVVTLSEVAYVCPNGSNMCDVNLITTLDGEKFLDMTVAIPESFAGADATVCPGDSTQLNAFKAGYTNYVWTPATGLSNPNISNPKVSPSQTTTYSIAARDATGCLKLDNLTVTVRVPITAAASAVNTSCGLINGSVSVSVQGGSGNFTYKWMPNVSTGSTANILASGNYLITVTDANTGCTDEAFTAVSATGSAINALQTAVSATSLQPTSGKICMNLMGGIPPYTLTWSGPVSGNQSNVTNNIFAIPNLSTGQYMVSVTDAVGCTSVVNSTVLLNVVDNLLLSLSALPDTSCCLGKGVINVIASGGNGVYTFNWSPNPGTLTDLGNGLYQIKNVEAGIYKVTLTDVSGLTRIGSITVANGCVCKEIFEDEVLLEPSGVEAICIGIPFIYHTAYPLAVNGVPYTGPFHPCEFDSVVYYAFSFLPDNGYDGPFKISNWMFNGVTHTDVVFADIYDLSDSMSVWDPLGNWFLDDQSSIIYGGDPYEQSIYGALQMSHLPTWTPFTIKPNYTGFAYGTEIYVVPFDGKVVVTAYDSTTCCTDSLCVIFVNPCEDLIPSEPYTVFDDAPNLCVPIPYSQLNNYYLFYDNYSVLGFTSACVGGTNIPITGDLGFHELIVIDTVRWCGDTVPIVKVHRPLPLNIPEQTLSGLPTLWCIDSTELIGSIFTVSSCGDPTNGTLTLPTSGLCVTYTSNSGFVGQDNACVVVCDEFGLCDTTNFQISLLSPAPPLLTVVDTFRLITDMNVSITDICFTSELLGATSDITFCGLPSNALVDIVSSTCFNYSPYLNFIGLDTVCVYVCDDASNCDTATYIIEVVSPLVTDEIPNIDTVYLITSINMPIGHFCIDTSELVFNVDTMRICENPLNGYISVNNLTCIKYEPAPDFVGEDHSCVIICDEAGVCDTTYLIIEVIDNTDSLDTLMSDTLNITTDEGVPVSSLCVDLTQLIGNPLDAQICGQSLNGVLTSTGAACYMFTPTAGFVGNTTACIYVCDDAIPPTCDTTFLQISVISKDSTNGSTLIGDTLTIITDFEIPTDTICIPTTLIGSAIDTVIICQQPVNGFITILGDSCFVFTPDSAYIGADTACVIVCSGAVCDTLSIIITVNPPPDCQVFSTEGLIFELFPNQTKADVCISNLSFNELVTYQVQDNGLPYTGGFKGCAFDSCFAYTYFTVPDLGTNGPYRLDYWNFGGNVLTIDTFMNIAQLVDSFHVWDAQANWLLDPLTLTIKSCTAVWQDYGDIKITQLNTQGVAKIEINVNLVPKGVQLALSAGPHVITLLGDNCVDTLLVNVMLSNEIKIDTFIYTDMGLDTICLADLGVAIDSITSIEFLCDGAHGTDVTFVYDTLTHCMFYDGIDVGQDTFCLKFILGTDSCLYVTFIVTALEPLPCVGFLNPSRLDVSSLDCMTAAACVNFPFAIVNQYKVKLDGITAVLQPCLPNNQGQTQTSISISGVGEHTIIFEKADAPNCRDTIFVNVICDTAIIGGATAIVFDTLVVGQDDVLCFDAGVDVVSIQNICPSLSDAFVQFSIDTVNCVHYVGLDEPGTDTACIVVCYANGVCDTTQLIVSVIPDLPSEVPLPPIAVVDSFEVVGGIPFIADVLLNDTLHGALVSLKILVQPNHGSVGLTPDNSLSYLSDETYCNSTIPDSLQYEICNGIGCDTAWVYFLKPCKEFIIFNGFSPNGDGMNEVFFIQGIEDYPESVTVIYNRWGARVFEEKGYRNTWKGTFNGKDLPDGTYFYYLEDGKGKSHSGPLSIYR
jgi:gliding motility-associated-like protein